MESWRIVWRNGVAPLLSREQLERLKVALETDDQRLLQGATCSPPCLACVADWLCEATCLLGYCGTELGEATVAEVENTFANLCYQADNRLGEPTAIRWLLTWWDDSIRSEAIAALLPEVDLALSNL